MRELSEAAVVANVSDLHTNATTALMAEDVTLDDGQVVSRSRIQDWIWECWEAYWRRVRDIKQATGFPVVAVINGESVDHNWHKTVQSVTEFEPVVARLGLAALAPALAPADYFLFTRGTEAHTGLGGSLDELVAEMVSLQGGRVIKDGGRYSWPWFWGRFGGVSFDIAHHPGHGYMREWTKGGDANRLAASIVMRYAMRGLPIPQFTLRGHNHKPTDSAGNFPTRAIITPSWKLTDAFGHRLGGGGDWLPIGGQIIVCEQGRPSDPEQLYYHWPVIADDIWTPDRLQFEAAAREQGASPERTVGAPTKGDSAETKEPARDTTRSGWKEFLRRRR